MYDKSSQKQQPTEETISAQGHFSVKISINQSIKYSFIDKKDNPPDTNASGVYRRVVGGKDE